MKKYIGTKEVLAQPMSAEVFHTLKGGGWVYPGKINPKDEGYHVKYPDGYESWCPKEQFESAYKGIADGVSFGHAIELMKKGRCVARKGWNGKGMFLFLATNIAFDSKTELEYCDFLDNDHIMPSIVMKTADDHFCVGWLASQADMLAMDWYVV